MLKADVSVSLVDTNCASSHVKACVTFWKCKHGDEGSVSLTAVPVMI